MSTSIVVYQGEPPGETRFGARREKVKAAPISNVDAEVEQLERRYDFEQYLDTISKGGFPGQFARAIGYSTRSVQRWAKRHDPDGSRYKEARAAGSEVHVVWGFEALRDGIGQFSVGTAKEFANKCFSMASRYNPEYDVHDRVKSAKETAVDADEIEQLAAIKEAIESLGDDQIERGSLSALIDRGYEVPELDQQR